MLVVRALGDAQGIDRGIGSSAGPLPPSAAQNGLVNGTYNNNVVILSGQLSYAF